MLFMLLNKVIIISIILTSACTRWQQFAKPLRRAETLNGWAGEWRIKHHHHCGHHHHHDYQDPHRLSLSSSLRRAETMSGWAGGPGWRIKHQHQHSHQIVIVIVITRFIAIVDIVDIMLEQQFLKSHWCSIIFAGFFGHCQLPILMLR